MLQKNNILTYLSGANHPMFSKNCNILQNKGPKMVWFVP